MQQKHTVGSNSRNEEVTMDTSAHNLNTLFGSTLATGETEHLHGFEIETPDEKADRESN